MSDFNSKKAIVSVVVDGLAFFYENDETKNWEFLFLRHLENPARSDKHELRIKFSKTTFNSDGEDKKLIHQFNSSKEHQYKIEIEPNEVIKGHSTEVRDKENFNFNEETEPYDLGWMPVFPWTTNRSEVLKIGDDFDPKEDLSLLSLPQNSTLYTKNLSEANFEIWERTEAKKTIDGKTVKNITRKLLSGTNGRKIGITVGADLNCQPGTKLTFKVEGGFGYQFDILIEEGANYEIAFDNSCVDNPTCAYQSDIKYYYDVIPSDTELELLPIPMDGGRARPGSTAACSPSPLNPGGGRFLKDYVPIP